MQRLTSYYRGTSLYKGPEKVAPFKLVTDREIPVWVFISKENDKIIVRYRDDANKMVFEEFNGGFSITKSTIDSYRGIKITGTGIITSIETMEGDSNVFKIECNEIITRERL